MRRAAHAARERFTTIDERFILFMRDHSVTILRLALGIVFTWFGFLKLLGASPVAGLVASVLPWLDPTWTMRGLGVWETAIGLLLLAGTWPRVALGMLWVLLTGTFLVFIVNPAAAFQAGNPFRLTMEGEFVVKNLVLIAAGMVVGAGVHWQHQLRHGGVRRGLRRRQIAAHVKPVREKESGSVRLRPWSRMD